MKWINEYFFGEDAITLSDGLWFYGSIGFVVLITILLFVSS